MTYHRGYTKKTAEQINSLIRYTQTDVQQMKLLQILDPQLEQLVDSGSPDLRGFYQALKREKLISDGELCELQKAFALEGVSNQSIIAIPQSDLIESGCLARRRTQCRSGSLDQTCQLKGSQQDHARQQ